MSTAPDVSSETVSVRGEAGGSTLVPRFWLLVVAGPDAGATLSSTGDRTLIGTYDTCDLVLHDSTVSRFHCEIGMQGGRPVVRDLGSLNGTVVNGVGALAAYLPSGVTIGVGRTHIRFDIGSENLKATLSDRTRFGALVGKSVAMRRAFALLERAAALDVPVLLEGEPGSGRRTAALAVHDESGRRDGPFVAVDCSAATPERVEAELFGSASGPGAFESARDGTLYLSEVADLPPETQQKILRVLERKEVRRLGAVAAQTVNARVVAGSSRPLRTEVNAKRFRSDLFYRLAAQEVRLPPLRERRDDLPLLVAELAGRRGVPGRAAELLDRLGARPYTGNVGELAAAIHTLVGEEGTPWPRIRTFR